MPFLRLFVTFLVTLIFVHTALTVLNHGWDFVSVFVTDLFSLTWRGQFSLDFLSYLMLSGLWVAWRGGFTGPSIAQGIAAATLGLLFFGVLLLIYMTQSRGDLRALILGVHDTYGAHREQS